MMFLQLTFYLTLIVNKNNMHQVLIIWKTLCQALDRYGISSSQQHCEVGIISSISQMRKLSLTDIFLGART